MKKWVFMSCSIVWSIRRAFIAISGCRWALAGAAPPADKSGTHRLGGAGTASCILTMLGKAAEARQIDLTGTWAKTSFNLRNYRLESFTVAVHSPAQLDPTVAAESRLPATTARSTWRSKKARTSTSPLTGAAEKRRRRAKDAVPQNRAAAAVRLRISRLF